MKTRAITVLSAIAVASQVEAIDFTLTPITLNGADVEALSVKVDLGNRTFAFVRTSAPERIWNRWTGRPLPLGTNTFGAYADAPYDQRGGSLYGRASASDSNSGKGYVVNMRSGEPYSSTAITDGDGPVVAVRDGVSVIDASTSLCLFEVRPTTDSRKILVHDYKRNVRNLKRTFPLAPGDMILDACPRDAGGLIILTGTPSSAYVNYVDVSGTLNGPFPVGAASQVLYSPLNGGTVFTAGSDLGGMRFTRGPLGAGITESQTVPLPLANQGFRFTAGSITSNGTCWWGGAYKTLAGDDNGFVSGVRNGVNLEPFATETAGTESFDDQVNDIIATDHGIGMWVGVGQAAFFSLADGSLLSAYPSNPNPKLQFRALSAHPLLSYALEGSIFSAVSFDPTTGKSMRLDAELAGDLHDAFTSVPTVVGGTELNLYGRLYMSKEGTVHAVSYSDPEVTGPAAISFHSNQIQGIRLSTVAVKAAKEITVAVGNGFPKPVTAKFMLLPPTPRFFTPSSQSVVGGRTAVSRLTLTGKAPIGGLSVALDASRPELLVDNQVLVPHGLWSRSFAIRTAVVSAPITGTITATYANVSKTTDITVTP